MSGAPSVQGQAPAASDVATVHVAVTDENGIPVTDLTKAEFVVREDGKPQEILEVLRDTTTPLLVGVLVDISGSTRIGKHRKDNLQALSGFFMKTIQDSSGAFLVSFSDAITLITKVTSSRAVFELGLKRLAETEPKGSTALYDSIYGFAGETFEGRTGRRIILAVSDFTDNASGHRLDETIARAQQMGAEVFALVEGGLVAYSKRTAKRAREAAERVARETGGAAYVFESPQELEAALERVRLILRNSYALKYRATGISKKGKRVPVRIEVLRKGVEVLAPRGRPPAVI